MEEAVERGLDWAGLPVIATVARPLSSFATGLRAVTPAEGVAGVRRCPGPPAGLAFAIPIARLSREAGVAAARHEEESQGPSGMVDWPPDCSLCRRGHARAMPALRLPARSAALDAAQRAVLTKEPRGEGR